MRGLVFGIGYANQSRALVALSSVTTVFTLVGLIPDYVVMLGGVVAIDAGVLYGLLHNDTAPAAAEEEGPPMDLVGVSLDTARIVSHVRACPSLDLCPWSFHFLP